MMDLMDSPTFGVIPVLVGPLQALVVLLPAIVLALISTFVSLFRPRAVVGFLRLVWHLKIQVVLVAGVAYGLYWLGGAYWPDGTGATAFMSGRGAKMSPGSVNRWPRSHRPMGDSGFRHAAGA